MTAVDTSIISSQTLLILVPFLLGGLLGFACWYFARRRRESPRSDRNVAQQGGDTKRVQVTVPSKYNSTPSPLNAEMPVKTRSASASQLTTTDIAYMNKLVRTASDRSLWANEQPRHIRKVPSGHV